MQHPDLKIVTPARNAGKNASGILAKSPENIGDYRRFTKSRGSRQQSGIDTAYGDYEARLRVPDLNEACLVTLPNTGTRLARGMRVPRAESRAPLLFRLLFREIPEHLLVFLPRLADSGTTPLTFDRNKLLIADGTDG